MMIQSTAANHTSSKVYSTAAAAKCQNIGNKDLCYLPRKTECTTRRMNWSSSCCQTTAQCWSPTQPAHNGTVLNTDSAYTTAQCWSPTQPAHNGTVLDTDSLHTMSQCRSPILCPWHTYQKPVPVSGSSKLVPELGTSFWYQLQDFW